VASNVGPPDQIAYLIQISELVRNYGLVVAAGVGVALAWWRSRASNRQAIAALQQAGVAQRNHVVEMFNRAVDQLGSEKLEVRLGAIYLSRESAVIHSMLTIRFLFWKRWLRLSGNGRERIRMLN
jgi:hypothetical protein